MKIKPRYRGRARASPAGAPSEVSNYIPPELESIHYRDFVEFYQNNDILQISTKTSLIEWVDVLDKIDDFLSDRELPSSYLIKILGVLCALLTKTNDVRVFNSLERLVDLLWHSDCLVVLQNLHCIIALLKNLTARVSSKFVTPLRTRLQFLATGLVAFDSQSLKAIYTGEERPSSKPFTISGPSLDESVVIDVRNMGDDPVDVASKIVAKLPSSEICAFQINHRVAHMLGSKLTRQLYVHIILRAIQAGVLLPSSSSYVQLSGTVHMGQQIVALIEDLDRLPSLPQDEDIVVIALQTLQTLSSFDCYRRRMIEANIFEENGIVLNGFLLAAENLRVSIGSVSEDDLIYKRFSAYTSLISELVPSRGSSLVPDITSRSDCLSVVGTAIDDDVIVRSLVSILNCSSVCPFRTVNDVCSCLITLLLNNSAARTAFLDQNAFGPVFNQIRLILDCAPVPDSKLKEFHGAIQLLLRVILILLQRTRATLSQQILPDVSFVRVMTHLWETCMIGSSPASTPFNQSRVSSTVDMRALLMNISEPPSSASSPSHTPANQSSASSADAPAMRGSFSPTESGLLVFTTACNVVSRFIQNRPRSSQSLHREGITASYLQWFPLVLDSVSRCKPEYRESMIKILLDLIRSLSIHSAGLSAVLSADPVRRVLQLFESPEMHQFFSSSPSTVQSIGRSVEEWIRHYPDFEEPVLTAIINFLCRLQDGPGALIFGDVRDRLTSAHTLDEVFDQAIINISSFIKCVVQKHMTKFCALNGPSQLCAFASAPGACQRILGISRSSDSRESLPAFVVPSFPKSSALAGPSSFTAGKLTTAGDALADSYAWLAAQPPRLPVDVLFDRLQKSCESIIYSQAFQSPNFLWPFDELLNSRHSEQALEQAASVSSLHFYVSILLRTVYRNPSFQIRQAPLTSIFAMLSKIVAKVDWALSGLDLDSSALCDDHMKDNATSSIISILTPFKFALAQFSMTVHGVMIVFSEKSSSRSSESSMFSSIVASHTLYMINYKPALVTPNLDDALCSWSDNSRQDSPTSVGGQQSLSASWCSLFRFTAQIFENARETLFCQKNPDSFSTQEIASVQTLLSDLLKSGGITRLVELWHWIIEVRPKDYRGSSHPWYTNNSGLSRSTSKKSRKTRNQSDAPTSMPYWQWPTEFDENLLQCLDILLIALSRFIAVLSSLPRAAFSSVHDKFPILAASLFESVWKHPSSFPLPVVISMLQSSQAFFNLHSRENNASQLNAPSRVPVPVSDTDEDQYDDDNGDRNPHDMDEDDGSQSVADRDPLDNEHRALMFAQLSEMGFADQHITWALDNSSVSDFNALVDWMVEHPFSASSAVAAATRSGPAPAATVPDANPISDPQHSSSESAASASFEDKFLSVSCPNVDCIAVERAVSAAPLLICISNSFKDDTHLTEYCAELSQYISRVIASKSNDDIRIAEFNEHFIQEVVQLLDSNSISNANQTVIVQTALSVCFQTIRASKPLGKQMACSPDLCRAVLRISHELLSFSESSPFAVHIALSISGLFSWLSSIWCSAGDGLLPQVSVSLDDRLQMTNFCIQLLSSPIASDLEVTQSLLTCLIVLLSQCHVAGVSASVKPILLVRRTLPFDNAKTIANLVDGVLQMLIEDRCLVKASIKKSLKTLLESSSSSEASLSQFFDRNRNVILRSVPDFADVVVTSCQFSKKASSLNSDFSSLTLRQSCPDLSHSVERSDWCNTLGDVVDQIIFLATNDNGASLSGSFGSSLCDPLRLLHAVRTTAHLHSPHLHKYLIEYVSQPQSDKQYRFIDVLILKLLTIRGSNLRTDVCNAELSTALAKDLRRAAQMTLIELCVAGDDIAIPVFECLRDAIRRDAGDDRCVARYATAILSLLRNSPNERDRACAMIKIGIIPTLIDALQSLNLKGQQFSECCDGILRALEAFGSLDLTTALDRFEPDIADAENQADSSCPMDIVSGFIDQFPNQGSRNSSLETLGNDVVDNVQEMVEENTNEDQEADVADQEDLALAERQNEEDDLHDDADGDIEDDIAASDFIHGLLHFGAPAHDEYEESEYDEEVDIANQNGDDDEEDDNEDEDDDELAIADLSSSTLNIRSSNIRGLHAFSQRIFPQQLSELAPIRRPVVDIGINFGNMPALNQTDERLRRVLDDFQSSLETSDIDVLVSNGSIPISRQEEMTRRRLSTASHGNIIVRASRHPDDELPWLNETSVAIRTSSSRPQTLRRNTVPGDGQRLREIILDSNARLPSRLQNRQLSGSMSSSSWATRMMELSGPRIKEAIGSYFRLEYEKQQTRMQIQAQQCQQPEPNALTEPVADETESVASTNVAVSVASGNAVGCPDIPMNTVEEHAVASADELEENMFQVAEMQFAPTSEPSEEAQGQAESTSASHNAESGLSEEERLAFLAALPPELQAEILLQDSRQQAANSNPEAINPSLVADIDSASIIATLPPDVREDFLMTQDDNFLSSLPPELMAEAVLLRQRSVYSERDEFPPSIRRRGQQARPPASTNVESVSQPPSTPTIPLLPLKLVVPLINLFKVRNFDCLTTVQRVIRIMAQFPQTRESLLKVLYSICIAFSPSRSSHPPKRLPFYLLSRALNTLRFLSKSSCREEILLWFLLPEDSAPIYDILPLLYVSRLDMSEATLLSLLGFLEDLLNVFKDGSGLAVKIKQSDVPVPSISSSAVANIVAIANAKICTARISDMIMSSISVFAKSPKNRSIIINELIRSLKTIRAGLQPFNLESRRPCDIALFQSMVLRNLNLLKSVIPDFKDLDEESSTAVMSCLSDLSPLWSELHRLLCSLQNQGSNNDSVANGDNFNTAVLEKSLQYKPFIEAMFVQRKIASTPELNKTFQVFCQTHRRILNFLCSRYPKLLSGSLSELISMRSGNILDFENKRRYFRTQLESQFSSFRSRYRSVKLQVRRSRLFEDSYHQVRNQTLDELRSHMTVHFMGEEGMDAGGLTREWFLIMSREIFNPNYALFRNAADSQVVFQPNKFSYWNPEHIDFFKFVGRFVGKAIYQGCLLDAYFTRSFYKHMLGIKPSFSDMESIDPDFFKSLKWMLANPIKGVLDLTFSAETHEFGERRVFALKPNGANIQVTDENKHKYVSLITELRTTTEIKSQIEAFVAGFHELIPRELINVFNDHDLELLICGLPEIDISDLRANTEYHGLSETSDVIQWFWAALQSFTSEEKALFIQFVTGTSKVPIGGFRVLQGMSGIQKFQIHRATGIDRLPTTHTCFNQLDLPDYSSPDSLADKLRLAISEGATGFGFA